MINWKSINAKFDVGWDGLMAFRSERFVVIAAAGKSRSKIFQIIFWKNNSIFVDFPFFMNTTGVVSLVTYPANAKPPIDLSYIDGGKVTSHLVKFSYPPDGNAHFSQDGKVYSRVRKPCRPISKIDGHFFTIQIQGLQSFSQFDLAQENISNPRKKSFVEAVFDKVPQSIKIVGWLYPRNSLRKRTTDNFFGPIMRMQDANGKQGMSCIIAPPAENNPEYTLLLTVEAIPKIDKNGLDTLSFIGGFDDKAVTDDITKETTFLTLVYPAENAEELTRKIGSIDFVRKAT